VWAVDDSELSITTAKQNARRNGRGNCRFIAGDVSETLAQWKQSLSSIDMIVLNPPRKGVQAASMTTLRDIGVAKMIYVSCEPKSLARDLDLLAQQGYRITHLQPFDMFPQTEEVETVVKLEK
jgi:23S rRNA (uracil1939-C5)-methyltransferase